jgi:hypothetical protein
VLAAKLTKSFTVTKHSPVIAPERGSVPSGPDGDCDGDGVLNSVETDDDNDLLDDEEEFKLKLDSCNPDFDGDGVEDGFEHQSAIDLNKGALPFPAKTSYPNPMFNDANTDYDGDGLDLESEYRLWKYSYEKSFTAGRTRSLSYSDGKQNSREEQSFSDDERDEDGDGLSNYHEDSGPMTPEWWAACYSSEPPYPIAFVGTKPDDPDSDGDGILDGADDQDFDDVPNVKEVSRSLAGNVGVQGRCATTPDQEAVAPEHAWVNPFNPCLPNRGSRSCPIHPVIGQEYPPFMTDWKRYVFY